MFTLSPSLDIICHLPLEEAHGLLFYGAPSFFVGLLIHLRLLSFVQHDNVQAEGD